MTLNTGWDRKKADECADLFKEEYEEFLVSCSEEQLAVLRTLQIMWVKYFGTTGHKRLARVIVYTPIP